MTHDKACRPRDTHLSAAGLRARGWTARMVRQLLGEPDLLIANPYVRTAPQTRLYRVERVEAMEASEEFRTVAAASVRRSVAAKAAARRRRREVLARIAAEPVDVPRLPPDRLSAAAVAHRRRRDEERAHGQRAHGRRDRAPGPAAIGGAASEAPARWKVDYLRHHLPRHAELLDELLVGPRGRAARAAAEELLRRRVYAAIAEAYPDLTQECERQLREREFGPPRVVSRHVV
jgi:hypothetical protein